MAADSAAAGWEAADSAADWEAAAWAESLAVGWEAAGSVAELAAVGSVVDWVGGSSGRALCSNTRTWSCRRVVRTACRSQPHLGKQ